MVILGVDPGLKATGYSFIKKDNGSLKVLETGAIEPKQKDLIQGKLFKIFSLLDELIVRYQPSIMVLEKLYAHHHYTTTASILGHVRGVICLLCAKNALELEEFSVKRIRKAVTGNGNASKGQTQRVIGHLLNIDGQKLTLDASDACALALGYIHINDRKL